MSETKTERWTEYQAIVDTDQRITEVEPASKRFAEESERFGEERLQEEWHPLDLRTDKYREASADQPAPVQAIIGANSPNDATHYIDNYAQLAFHFGANALFPLKPDKQLQIALNHHGKTFSRFPADAHATNEFLRQRQMLLPSQQTESKQRFGTTISESANRSLSQAY
jgi:hypothetical protein